MTDDIVTRLREIITPSWIDEDLLEHEIDTIRKAADEIERLRYEVVRWKQLAKQEIVMCDPNDPCAMCKELAAE